MTIDDTPSPAKGTLVAAAGKCFPLTVCKSRAGYYIGTCDEEGLPFSRESEEYWQKPEAAQNALNDKCWTQRRSP